MTKTRSPKDADVYAGEMLRYRRQELGLTQKQLAEYTGVTFQQIQKYEKGRNRIGVSRLSDFASFLEVSVSYFYEEEYFFNGKDQSLYNLGDSSDNSELIMQLVQNFNCLQEDQKKLLLDVMKSFISKNNDE
jgi:transcriptional regulator with XRE-family HTH domain